MSARAKSLVLLLFLAVSAAAVWRFSSPRGGEVRAHEGDVVARPARARAPAEQAAAEEESAAAQDGQRVSLDVAPKAADVAPWAEIAEGFDDAALYGTIEDPEARPLAGARVLLFPEEGPVEECGAPLATARTNADGRFRFPALGAFEGFRLYADAEGFLPALISRRTGVDEELQLARAAPFAGRVTDADSGAPLPGVEIAVWNPFVSAAGTLSTRCASLTDAEGRYSIPCGRLERTQRVDVRRPGALPSAREFQVRADRPDGYDIELGAGARVDLWVYDLDTGLGLPERELKLGSDVTLTTDAHGAARVEGPALATLKDGALVLDVKLPGWCQTTRTVTVPPEGLAEPVPIPMLRGATVAGLVRAKGAGPIAGAHVALNGRNRQLAGYDLPPRTSLRSESVRVESDAAGRFELRGILPGAQQLVVSAWSDERPARRSAPFALPSASSRQEVELELEAGGRLSGTVTLNGEPALAQVGWSNGDGSGRGSSNDSGAYRMRGVAAGEVHLSATVEDGSYGNEQHDEVVWVEDGAEQVHDIRLNQARATIAGLVQDSDGNPVPGIDVSCYAENTDGNDWHFAQGKSDKEGRFELKVDDKPGVLYTVTAADGGRTAHRSEVAVGAENVALVLPRMGKLRLEVVDAATRERVDSYSVYWRNRDSGEGFQAFGRSGRTVAPGSDGIFEAELPIGPLDLRIAAREKGYAPCDVPNVLVTEGEGGAPERVELDRGVTLELRIVSVSGQRAPQVTLVTEEQRAELQASGYSAYAGREIHAAQRAQPGPDGKAVLKALAPGRYYFHQAPKGSVFEPASFEIPAVDVHSVEVRWWIDQDAAADKEQAALGGIGYAGF